MLFRTTSFVSKLFSCINNPIFLFNFLRISDISGGATGERGWAEPTQKIF
jgi:hypothetical protein